MDDCTCAELLDAGHRYELVLCGDVVVSAIGRLHESPRYLPRNPNAAA